MYKRQSHHTAASSNASEPRQLHTATDSRGAGAILNSITCDKCDGPHRTDTCPHFRKARENHPDARASGRKQLGEDGGKVEILSRGRIVRQPGDGSCLFHSLCFSLRDGTTAHALRRQIGEFIEANPEHLIADSPLREWILWDSACSVPAYCRKITTGGAWGGGIEMAVVAHIKQVAVHVYESHGSSFKRISRFPAPKSHSEDKIIRVLYRGGVHYDALEV